MEKEFDNIGSYLFWSGFYNKSIKERNKYIFNALDLQRFCNDKTVIDYYKTYDRNKEYMNNIKKNSDLCVYICKRLMRECYKDRLDRQYDETTLQKYNDINKQLAYAI